MKNIIIALTTIFCAYTLATYAQGVSVPADTAQSVNNVVETDTSANAVQSVNNDDADSLDVFDSDDVSVPDSAAAADKKPDKLDDFDSDEDIEIVDAPADSTASAQKLGGVRRGYDRKRQVTLAIVMMILIALALGTSQAFNPK